MKEYRNLFAVFNSFMQIKSECRFCVIEKYKVAELSLKQIEYLKKFDELKQVTISQLAEVMNLSKPSITEMVKKFIKLNCVKKEQCAHDARVYYLFLTERGKAIARIEQLANEDFFKRIKKCLDDKDINQLIELLAKID